VSKTESRYRAMRGGKHDYASATRAAGSELYHFPGTPSISYRDHSFESKAEYEGSSYCRVCSQNLRSTGDSNRFDELCAECKDDTFAAALENLR